MLQQMWSAEEFLELRALDYLEPSGDTRLDLLVALICQTVANHSMGRKKAARLDEFLLEKLLNRDEEQEEEKSGETFKDAILGWAKATTVNWKARGIAEKGGADGFHRSHESAHHRQLWPAHHGADGGTK